MPLADVCVHTATPVSTRDDDEAGTWIEGEPDEKVVKGEPFDCFFLISIRRRSNSNFSGAREEANFPTQRKIESPTILFEDERDDGTRVEISAEDEVDIVAEEILGADPIRFQVEGDPIPLAKPGEVIGWEARLRRVID